jgi:hypothetical protein
MADLEIRFNNCATNDPCALCGERCDPRGGPDLFLKGTWNLVCDRCGEETHPALMAKLREMQEHFVETGEVDPSLMTEEQKAEAYRLHQAEEYLSRLEAQGYLISERDAAGTKIYSVTEKGRNIRQAYAEVKLAYDFLTSSFGV